MRISGAEGGIRTHTWFPTEDFESSASAVPPLRPFQCEWGLPWAVPVICNVFRGEAAEARRVMRASSLSLAAGLLRD